MDRVVSNCEINSIDQHKVLSDVDIPNERKYLEAHSQNILKAPIFKLNRDCLHKIFDYLSFYDIHSIGKTCKPMQLIAGEYFQANYVTEAYVDYRDITYPGLGIEIEGFNKFIQNLLFGPVHPSKSLKKKTWFVAKNYNQEFKRLRFYEADLTGVEIKNLSDKFEKVESVTIERCIVNQKFYQQFPKLCKNLRRLYVEDFDGRRNVLRRTGNEWLLWTYPKLEHLHWIQSRNWRPINELKQFFERNPRVRSFTTDIDSLWINRRLFSEHDILLDDLNIEIGREDEEPRQIEYIYRFLKELYEMGVYKRLHIHLKWFSQRTINEIPPLNTIKSLCLDHNVNDDDRTDLTSSKWPNLTELKSSCYARLANVNVLAQQFVNLRRIYLYYISLNDLMHFVRYSVYLTKVKIKMIEHNDDDDQTIILDVAALNKEREKLNGAEKMIIYVDDEVYVETKWALNGTEYSLIEIRRVSSHEWGHLFIPLY